MIRNTSYMVRNVPNALPDSKLKISAGFTSIAEGRAYPLRRGAGSRRRRATVDRWRWSMKNLRNWALAVAMVFALTGLSAAQGWRHDNDHDRDDRKHDKDRHDNGRHEGWYKHDHDRAHDRNSQMRYPGGYYPNGGYRYPTNGGYYGGYPNSGYYGGYPNGGYPTGGYYGGYPNGGYNNGGYYNGGRQAYNIGYQDGMRHGQSDRMTGHSYRPTHDDDYRNADRGYSSAYGNRQGYKDQYRNGYM